MRECSKAAERRERDPAFVEHFFAGDGIDVGAGPDGLDSLKARFPLIRSVRLWDMPDGDAMLMAGVPDESFDFVHSSHCLEHLMNPATAIENWLRILKPGGYVVCTIPDEDMYEQGVWPSTFNPDHKFTFTIWKRRSWSARSVSLLALFTSLIPEPEVIKIESLQASHDWARTREDQTLGPSESAIEFVLRKRPTVELERGGREHGAVSTIATVSSTEDGSFRGPGRGDPMTAVADQLHEA